MPRKRAGDLSSAGARRRQLDRVYAKYEGICQMCFKFCPRSEASREHVIDLSLGGSNGDENVILAHKACNCAKSNQLVSVKHVTDPEALPHYFWTSKIKAQIWGCIYRQKYGREITGPVINRFVGDPEIYCDLAAKPVMEELCV